MNETSSIYGLWNLRKDEKLNFQNSPILNRTIQNVNGTCFFINSNTFITCHHILNSKTFKENYVFLFNNHMIHNDIEIIHEIKDYDLTIGKTKTPTQHFLDWSNSRIFEKGQQLKLYGYPKLKETIKILLLSHKNSIQLLRISKQPTILMPLYVRSQSIKDEGVPADSGILIKNCDVHILTPEAPPGFSGSPLLNLENAIIGMQSMGADTKIEGNLKPCSIIIDIKSIVASLIKI
jgi:hypothetical protein